ncbi:hypothetical protein Bca4012_082771 [Brassica carinata]
MHTSVAGFSVLAELYPDDKFFGRAFLEAATGVSKNYRTRVHGEAVDFVTELQDVHRLALEKLQTSTARYKHDADKKRRELIFAPGDLVWVVLTKDRFPAREYNKLKSRKIGPVEVLERINPNAYRIRLPPHLRTSDVFNVFLRAFEHCEEYSRPYLVFELNFRNTLLLYRSNL